MVKIDGKTFHVAPSIQPKKKERKIHGAARALAPSTWLKKEGAQTVRIQYIL